MINYGLISNSKEHVVKMLINIIEYINKNGQAFDYELFDEVEGLTEFWNEYSVKEKEYKTALMSSAINKLTSDELEVLDIKIKP